MSNAPRYRIFEYLESLARRGYVGTALTIIRLAWHRADVRGLMLMPDPPMVAVLFWSMLRWERKLALAALEHLGVDFHSLEDDVDALLRDAFDFERRIDPGRRSEAECDAMLEHVLKSAEEAARELGNNWVGDEHLLLAITRTAEPPLAEVLARHNIDTERVNKAIADVCKPDEG